jgi:dolichol-phosphate mannosyltransferase
MIALREGYKLSKGEFTISLDCDLQDPPDFINELVQEYLVNSNNFDCIIGRRENRKVDSFVKKQTAKAYYWLARKFISSNIVQDAADYRLITNNFRNQLLNYIGPFPIYRVIVPLSTNRIKVLNYTRNVRFAGKSNYNYKKMFQLASLSFFYFSRLPLNILNALVIFSILFNLFILYYILYAYYFEMTVAGWSSNVFILSLSMLLVIVFINIFGKYTYHNFLTSQGLPLVTVSLEKIQHK